MFPCRLPREELLAIARRHGARRVRVCGSWARGTARPGSDVDFIVELEPGRGLLDVGALLMDWRALLGVDVEIITEGGLRDEWREKLLAEAVEL